MKTLIFLTVVISLFTNPVSAQPRQVDKYFEIDPNKIERQNHEIQKYDVTLKWQNLDAISGRLINCNAVGATYVIGLEEDSVKWKNVRLAKIENFQQTQFQGKQLPAFENFSYKALDTSFLSDAFYENIPGDQRDLAKWLVSDAVQMQGLALYVFDSLEFKKEFTPKLLDNYDIHFEDWVTFTSRYQKLIWTGISKHNNEICAIVKFESFYNPVKIDTDQMSLEGRALYYGEMWISLEDKQVEYATMLEDDIFKLRSPLFPNEQLIDLQREIVFNKR